MSIDALNGILLCPLSGEVLRADAGQLKSSRLTVPNIDGIPWLYRDPKGALLQWRKKTADVLEYSRQQMDAAEAALARPDLLPATRTRLKRIFDGQQKNIEHLSRLLASIHNSPNEPDEISTLERVPRQQAAMAYQATLFRDWVWGREQVKGYAGLLQPSLKGRKRICFPGAGACGLPLAIHEAVKPALSLAVDINPLLFFPVKRLLAGETVSLIEFPRFPRESSGEYVEHQLKSQGPVAPGFQLLFADGQSLPIKDGAFDAVVTSWFIDIVSRDLRELARLLNAVMEMGGVWVNIGPLGFERNDLSEVYRPDEVREILTEAGFEVESWSTPDVPYLQSPYDTVGRHDQVFVFTAKKTKATKRPSVYNYWPHWLASTSEPVPQTEAIRTYRVKSAIYTFVLDQVDGTRSIEDMAQVLSREFSIPPDEALRSVHAFFANFYEGVIYREF